MNPEFDRRDLANLVAETTGQSPDKVLETLKAAAAVIRAQVAQGLRVEWHELGVFDLGLRKGRIYRNPQTGAGEMKPDRLHIPFRAASRFKVEVAAQRGMPCI